MDHITRIYWNDKEGFVGIYLKLIYLHYFFFTGGTFSKLVN